MRCDCKQNFFKETNIIHNNLFCVTNVLYNSIISESDFPTAVAQSNNSKHLACIVEYVCHLMTLPIQNWPEAINITYHLIGMSMSYQFLKHCNANNWHLFVSIVEPNRSCFDMAFIFGHKCQLSYVYEWMRCQQANLNTLSVNAFRLKKRTWSVSIIED